MSTLTVQEIFNADKFQEDLSKAIGTEAFKGIFKDSRFVSVKKVSLIGHDISNIYVVARTPGGGTSTYQLEDLEGRLSIRRDDESYSCSKYVAMNIQVGEELVYTDMLPVGKEFLKIFR